MDKDIFLLMRCDGRNMFQITILHLTVATNDVSDAVLNGLDGWTSRSSNQHTISRSELAFFVLFLRKGIERNGRELNGVCIVCKAIIIFKGNTAFSVVEQVEKKDCDLQFLGNKQRTPSQKYMRDF